MFSKGPLTIDMPLLRSCAVPRYYAVHRATPISDRRNALAEPPCRGQLRRSAIFISTPVQMVQPSSVGATRRARASGSNAATRPNTGHPAPLGLEMFSKGPLTIDMPLLRSCAVPRYYAVHRATPSSDRRNALAEPPCRGQLRRSAMFVVRPSKSSSQAP